MDLDELYEICYECTGYGDESEGRRMIDEKKLIGDLIPILNKNDDMFLAGGIIGTIDKQPQVGSWIPVSERLPKEDGSYLCTYGKYHMGVYRFTNDLYTVDDYDFAEYKHKKRKGFYTFDSEWGYCEVDYIKAWQPLPEPFKEEEDV